MKIVNITLLILFIVAFQSKACTVIVAGKKATVDGSVLNSHTDAGADCRIGMGV